MMRLWECPFCSYHARDSGEKKKKIPPPPITVIDQNDWNVERTIDYGNVRDRVKFHGVTSDEIYSRTQFIRHCVLPRHYITNRRTRTHGFFVTEQISRCTRRIFLGCSGGWGEMEMLTFFETSSPVRNSTPLCFQGVTRGTRISRRR